eukprot:CAMPEP_0116877914 /NCGR_PEP_ID=MMETSP0463-20121206/9668_1 /TAXON_ID=181622 /ORGANISM="Strombidinopsis sp, Strain SopsisLIS2011" /LENGTH=90 /DNA_ID=CAMNT_0004525619 /DNA_START=694 /DNA_END=966 /DNA_ORIENTATION=+
MASLNESGTDLHQVKEDDEDPQEQSSYSNDQSNDNLKHVPTNEIKQKYQNNVQQFNEDEEDEYGEEDDVKRRSIKGDRSAEVQQQPFEQE